MVRAAGLHGLSALPPLRALFMREGIEPGRGLDPISATERGSINASRLRIVMLSKAPVPEGR